MGFILKIMFLDNTSSIFSGEVIIYQRESIW